MTYFHCPNWVSKSSNINKKNSRDFIFMTLRCEKYYYVFITGLIIQQWNKSRSGKAEKQFVTEYTDLLADISKECTNVF